MFAQEQGFSFRLLSDADRSVGEDYQAKRPPDHQWADFPRRLSYLIDPEGIVVRTYRVEDVVGHPAEVLKHLEELQKGGA